MRIQTERLLLRSMQAEDIPALVALWMDPDATRFMGGPRERAFLEQNFADDLANHTPPVYDLWPVVEQASGQIIGNCGLLDKEVEGVTEIELVYVLAPAYWGQGYATEMSRALVGYAASRLALPRLIALIAPDNAASAAVARRVGMTHERDIVRPSGKPMQLYGVTLTPA